MSSRSVRPPLATRIQRPPVLSTPSRANEPGLSAASSAEVESRNAVNSSVTAWRDAAYPFTVQAVSAPFTRTVVSTPRVIVTRSAAASETGRSPSDAVIRSRSEEHTSELQSRLHLVCRLLLEKKKEVLACARVEDVWRGP